MPKAKEVILLLCQTSSIQPSSISRKDIKWEASLKISGSSTAWLTQTITTLSTALLKPLYSPLKMQQHYCWFIWLSIQILSWSTKSSISEPSSVYIITLTHQSRTDTQTSARPSHYRNHTHTSLFFYQLWGMKNNTKSCLDFEFLNSVGAKV